MLLRVLLLFHAELGRGGENFGHAGYTTLAERFVGLYSENPSESKVYTLIRVKASSCSLREIV